MAKPVYRCKYCGTPRQVDSMCSHCAEKLKLIRKLQAMVMAEKRREEARSRVRHTTNQTTN